MSSDNYITITGNLTRDPEKNTLPSGQSVINFMIAQTPRQFNRETNTWKDLEPNFFRVSAFGDLADNIKDSLSKGSRVIVQGEFRTERYTADGVERTSNNIRADEIGPSLRYASAVLTRNARKEGGFQQYANGGQSAPAQGGYNNAGAQGGYNANQSQGSDANAGNSNGAPF